MWPTFPILSAETAPKVIGTAEVHPDDNIPITEGTAWGIIPCDGWKPGDLMLLGLAFNANTIGSNEHFFPNSDRWVFFIGDHGDAAASIYCPLGSSNCAVYTILQVGDGTGVPFWNEFGSTIQLEHYFKICITNVDPKHPFSSVMATSQNPTMPIDYSVGYTVPASADAAFLSTPAEGFSSLDYYCSWPINDPSSRALHCTLARINDTDGFSSLTASQFVDTLYGHASLPVDVTTDIDTVAGSDFYKSDGNAWFACFGRNRYSATVLTQNNMAVGDWTVSPYLTETYYSDQDRTLLDPNVDYGNDRLFRPVSKTVNLTAGVPYTFILETGDSDTSTFTGLYVWMAIKRPSDNTLASHAAMHFWGIGAYGGGTNPYTRCVLRNTDGMIKWGGRVVAASPGLAGAPKLYTLYFVAPETGTYTLAFGSGNGFAAQDNVSPDGTAAGTLRPSLLVSKTGLFRDFMAHMYPSFDFYDGEYGGGSSTYFKTKTLVRNATHPASQVQALGTVIYTTDLVVKSKTAEKPRHKFSRCYADRPGQQRYSWNGNRINLQGQCLFYVQPTGSISDGILYPSTHGAPGKYYMEYKITADTTLSTDYTVIGIVGCLDSNLSQLTSSTGEKHAIGWGISSNSIVYRQAADGGSTTSNGTLGVTASVGDVFGIAHNCDTGETKFYQNGTLIWTSTLNDEWANRCAQFAWAKSDDHTFTHTVAFAAPFDYSIPTGFVAADYSH